MHIKQALMLIAIGSVLIFLMACGNNEGPCGRWNAVEYNYCGGVAYQVCEEQGTKYNQISVCGRVYRLGNIK